MIKVVFDASQLHATTQLHNSKNFPVPLFLFVDIKILVLKYFYRLDIAIASNTSEGAEVEYNQFLSAILYFSISNLYFYCSGFYEIL